MVSKAVRKGIKVESNKRFLKEDAAGVVTIQKAL
jgi:hypothetical protein